MRHRPRLVEWLRRRQIPSFQSKPKVMQRFGQARTRRGEQRMGVPWRTSHGIVWWRWEPERWWRLGGRSPCEVLQTVPREKSQICHGVDIFELYIRGSLASLRAVSPNVSSKNVVLTMTTKRMIVDRARWIPYATAYVTVEKRRPHS